MGSLFNIGPDINKTADDWCSQHVNRNFQGTLADLYTLITQQSMECQTYVKQHTILTASNNNLNICREHLQAWYKPDLDRLQAEDKQKQDTIASGLGNKDLYTLIAIIFISLVLLVFILF